MTGEELLQKFRNLPNRWGKGGRYPRGTVRLDDADTVTVDQTLTVPRRCGLIRNDPHCYQVPVIQGGAGFDHRTPLLTCELRKNGLYNGAFGAFFKHLGCKGGVVLGGAQNSHFDNICAFFFGTDYGIIIGKGSTRVQLSNCTSQFGDNGYFIYNTKGVSGINNHAHRVGTGFTIQGSTCVDLRGCVFEHVATPFRISGNSRSIFASCDIAYPSEVPIDLTGAHSNIHITGSIRKAPTKNLFYKDRDGMLQPMSISGDPTKNNGGTFSVAI